METRDNYEGCPAEVAEALKAGLEVRMWVWTSNVQRPEQEWVTGYTGRNAFPFECGLRGSFEHASLTDPRIPAKPDPRDYVGKWGVFWNTKITGFVLDRLGGMLKTAALIGFIRQGGQAPWKHFAPCDTIPTDPDKWPDDMLIFGPEDVR